STIAGHTIHRAFDGVGRLQNVAVGAPADKVLTHFYGGIGGPAMRALGNGIKTIYAYDALGRLERITERGASKIADWQYEQGIDGVPRAASLERIGGPALASAFRVDRGGRLLAEAHELPGALGDLAPDESWADAD